MLTSRRDEVEIAFRMTPCVGSRFARPAARAAFMRPGKLPTVTNKIATHWSGVFDEAILSGFANLLFGPGMSIIQS
jgi:hypothetical protein